MFRIGTSGFEYDHWRGPFYPRALPRRAWFAHYAELFDSVEINATFYRLPEPHTFEAWRERAQPGFCYALKFSRYGSHLKRLREPGATIPRFLERARLLGGGLGPVLVQLPPRWGADPKRLEAFLASWPRDRACAFEFRDESWLCGTVYRLLRAHGAALCIHDAIVDHPREITADWIYLRYHGSADGGSYSPQRLAAEARRIRSYLGAGLDVFAYFNNDRGGHAVANARDLRRYVLRT